MTSMTPFTHPTAWPDAPVPPAGFRVFNLEKAGGFVAINGPVFLKTQDEEHILGAWLTERHNNGVQITHGGWLASLMDITMPVCIVPRLNPRPLRVLTVSMSLDFMGSGKPGDWIEGRAELLRETSSLLFIQGILSVEGKAVLRGSAIFKKIHDRKAALNPTPQDK